MKSLSHVRLLATSWTAAYQLLRPWDFPGKSTGVGYRCLLCHLNELRINPLSVASFANIFSHSDQCLSLLFMISFAVQKLLSLPRSHLFIFAFLFIALGGGSKKILLWFMSEHVFLRFFSNSFIVSILIFRSKPEREK